MRCGMWWGSHGCDLPQGHEPAGDHRCDCCVCPEDMPPELHGLDGCVGRAPFYGPETKFYAGFYPPAVV